MSDGDTENTSVTSRHRVLQRRKSWAIALTSGFSGAAVVSFGVLLMQGGEARAYSTAAFVIAAVAFAVFLISVLREVRNLEKKGADEN
ncbi:MULTISPECIES: hypothetical protein [unclassified Microbacterium]|uniref:hypothetical protein n=1 Tax=unclassified Microbacterium TaxID=2609290 RepID=UPI0034667ACC